jgi:hypothetical protein
MTTYTLSQYLTNLQQALRRCAWWLSLVLIIVVTAFPAYWAVVGPAVAAPLQSHTPTVMATHQARQVVFDYLRIHSRDQPTPSATATLEAAQQGVVSYLQAHERAEQPPAFWDQAVQAVRAYISAHSR